MIRHMDRVFTPIPLVLSTTETGSMTNSKALEWNHGPMVPSMTVHTSTARNMEKAASPGPMAVPISVISKITTSRVMAHTTGPTAECSLDHG